MESGSEPKPGRGAGVVTIAIAIGAVIWAVSAGAVSESHVDDVPVCDATEYEGCPQRWEYLWADDD